MPTSKKAPAGNGSIRKRLVHGNTRWEIRYRSTSASTGRSEQHSQYFKTEKEAREKLREITAGIDADTFLEPSKLRLNEWCNFWLDECCIDLKPLTLKKYRCCVDNHIKPLLGGMMLSEIKPLHVQKFVNTLTRSDYRGNKKEGKPSGLSPKSVKDIHGVLSAALEEAVKQEIISRNPAAKATLPRQKKSEVRFLSQNEIEKFLSVVDTDEFSQLFKTYLFTGVREMELCGLPWANVNLKEGTIKISQQLQRKKASEGGFDIATTKSENVRTLKIAPYVVKILENQKRQQFRDMQEAKGYWKNENGLVFTKKDGSPISADVMYRHYKKLMQDIAPDTTIHTLRHTFATLQLQEGASIKYVQDALGHSTAAFTMQKYSHVSEAMKQEAADRMEAYINNLKQVKQA